MIRGMSALAPRYLEGYDRATGSTAPSQMTISRMEAENYIVACANKFGLSVEEVIQELADNDADELAQYVMSKGESPADTNAGLLVQAALLRANDIAVLSQSAGISEDDALAEIEAEESIHVEQGTADVDNILSAPLQAALKYCIDNFLVMMQANGECPDLKCAIRKLAGAYITPSQTYSGAATPANTQTSIASNFRKKNMAVGDDGSITDTADSQDTPIALPISVGSIVSQSTPVDTTVSAPGAITVNLPQAGGSPAPVNSGSSFLNILGSIAATASSVAKSAGLTTASLNTLGGGIGASSIQQYLQKNWIFVLIFVVIVSLMIIYLARATKH